MTSVSPHTLYRVVDLTLTFVYETLTNNFLRSRSPADLSFLHLTPQPHILKLLRSISSSNIIIVNIIKMQFAVAILALAGAASASMVQPPAPPARSASWSSGAAGAAGSGDHTSAPAGPGVDHLRHHGRDGHDLPS